VPRDAAALRARPLTADDFVTARAVVDGWFGHPVGLVMHRLFFDQLGPWGVWLAEPGGAAAGFLLGLVSAREPELAYVHMHVVAPAWRGRGAGERLYEEFCARAHRHGCRRVRALAAPERVASRRFHERLGFRGPLVEGYLGEGADRYIYERALPLGGARSGSVVTPLPSRPLRGPAQPGGHAMAEPTPHDDRRAHPREDVELQARVVAGDEVVDAQSVNLSEGGILLAGADFPSSSQVRIEIELAELGWHALDAEVVRHGEGLGGDTLAARFAEAATEGGRDAIRAFFAARFQEAEKPG
jgi:ribosomal protein S18 acetylase RimI-like enzyme